MAISKRNIEEIIFFFAIAFGANLAAKGLYDYLKSTGSLPWWATK